METKALIRKAALQQRDALSIGQRQSMSKQIMQGILKQSRYQKAECILVYAAYRSEVDTEGLIIKALQDKKEVYCPKVQGSEMEFYRIDSLEDLTEGYKGIREPHCEIHRLFTGKDEAKCLKLMPGSAYHEQRKRIGYGGGYYDKYLEKHNGLFTIALGFQCQMKKNIPADPYDKRPDVIVTECKIYQ